MVQSTPIIDPEYVFSSKFSFPVSKNHESNEQQALQSPLSRWNMSRPCNFSFTTEPKQAALAMNPSRKRSRDHIDDEELTSLPATSAHLAVVEKIEEPIYGPGMTLLNPSSGNMISAESQSGTWIEEKVEDAEEKRAEAQRPILRPSKSSRLDLMASFKQVETPTTSIPEPDIDPASMMLGVGWKVMASNDEDMQKAVRGWAKYIENHYPLNSVQIISKSEGKEAFLVQSDEGYWLFKEDLGEGRLISTCWSGCIAGLTSLPMVFEGGNTITAHKSSSPIRGDLNKAACEDVCNGMDLD